MLVTCLDNRVSWFKEHPNLHAEETTPVNVGAASGMQIDVTLQSAPEDHGCDRPCVDLYTTGVNRVSAYEGRVERSLIVDVGEETAVVNVSAPAGEAKEFFSKAQKLLDTVEWKGV